MTSKIEDPISDIVQGRLPNLNISAEGTAVKARAWISDCLANHPACTSKHISEGPTRLLEIAKDNITVRLVANDHDMAYATLSYCWGGDQEHKLTKGRLTSYQTAVPVTKLSQSIQDAIAVVRSIGEISYIWIDSLCIVQDDEDDKGRELSKMGDIYRGSVVTISAANAKSCRDGFLGKRRCPDHLRPVARLPFHSDDGRKGTVYLLPESAALSIGTDAINDRAWAFQEHVLPPRVLYFSSQQLYFACRSNVESDGGAALAKLPHFHRSHDIKIFAISLGDKSRIKDSKDVRVQWEAIIDLYSKRKLTCLEDRYVAIEGVCRQVAELVGTTHIAGFLDTWLVDDLWWRIETTQAPPSKPAGPSWSWVSVSGNVKLPEIWPTCSRLEVLSYDVKWKIPGLKSGRIECAVLRVRTWIKSQQIYFTGRGESPCFVINNIRTSLNYYPSTTDDWPEEESSIDAWLMQLYVSDGKETTMYGLVLEEVTPGVFKRKAAFSIDYLCLQLLGAEEHEDDSQGLEVHGSLGFQKIEIQLV